MSKTTIIKALSFLCGFTALCSGNALADSLAAQLIKAAPAANPDVIRMAVSALECATATGEAHSNRLTVIDYSLPSTAKRLWVFDLATNKVLFNEWVAHGKNTGNNTASRFSNQNGSLASSLGLFRTAETYSGKHGYSLRIDGLEPGFNNNARDRAIVFHGASYVDSKLINRQGRIGRSFGCPAVREGVAHELIDAIKGGQFVFSYYPDSKWLAQSRFLSCGKTLAKANDHTNQTTID